MPHADPERHRAYQREHARRSRARHPRTLRSQRWVIATLCNARRRARRVGVAFDPVAVREFLELAPDRCPIFGKPFIVGVRGGGPDAPSLDRKVSELGYTRGNLALISNRANAIKNDASADELRAVAAWMEGNA